MKKKNNGKHGMRTWVVVCALSAWPASAAADQVRIVKSIEARQAPAPQADPAIALERGQSAHILAAQGEWVEVEVAGQSGWLPSHALCRIDATTQAKTAARVIPTGEIVHAKRPAALLLVPRAGSAVVARTKPGEVLRVVNSLPLWLEVITKQQKKGWIEKRSVSAGAVVETSGAPTQIAPGAIVTAEGHASLLEGASPGSAPVAAIQPGDKLRIVSMQGGWAEAVTSNQKKGWVRPASLLNDSSVARMPLPPCPTSMPAPVMVAEAKPIGHAAPSHDQSNSHAVGTDEEEEIDPAAGGDQELGAAAHELEPADEEDHGAAAEGHHEAAAGGHHEAAAGGHGEGAAAEKAPAERKRGGLLAWAVLLLVLTPIIYGFMRKRKGEGDEDEIHMA